MAVRWEDREGPLLAALAELEDTGGATRETAAQAAADACGIQWSDAQDGIVRLIGNGYVEGTVSHNLGATNPRVHVHGLTEKGLIRAGLWPDPNANPPEALMQVLDRMEADEPDAERKGALARIRDLAGSTPRDVLTAVLVGYAQHYAGGG